MSDEGKGPGVYAAGADGVERLVHLYQGGEYALGDIVELFQLGRAAPDEREGMSAIELSRRDIAALKTMADAYSFDYPEAYIEMCLEMHRFASALAVEPIRFTANF